MLSEYLKHYAKAIFVPEKNNNKKYPKINLLELFSQSFKMMCNNFKYVVMAIVLFALAATIVSFLFNNSIICSLPLAKVQKTFKCASTISIVSIIFFLLKMFVISMFIRVWYDCVISKKNIKIFEFCLPRIVDIKIFFALLALLAINLLPISSFLLLQAREPNPDWIIESLFFAAVSLGFIIPLISVAYYVLLAFVVKKQKLLPFSTINQAIFSNITKIFFSTIGVMFLSTYIVAYYITLTIPYLAHNTFTNTICVEFMYNVLTFLLIAFY